MISDKLHGGLLIAFLQKALFRLRFSIWRRVVSLIRTYYFRLLGMRVGRRTRLGRISVTWPHQIHIGGDCLFEDDVHFKFDGPWQRGPSIRIGNHCFVMRGVEFNICKSIDIGDNSLIGSGSKFVDHDHGIVANILIRLQQGPEAPIAIGNDVWIGNNVVVLKGVTIGDGAIVGAGAVVTKSIPTCEIWAGVPASRIGFRPRNGTAKERHGRNSLTN